MGHVVLGVPFGQGAGQQLQAVLRCFEAFEDAAADYADCSIAFTRCSRVKQTLQAVTGSQQAQALFVMHCSWGSGTSEPCRQYQVLKRHMHCV